MKKLSLLLVLVAVIMIGAGSYLYLTKKDNPEQVPKEMITDNLGKYTLTEFKNNIIKYDYFQNSIKNGLLVEVKKNSDKELEIRVGNNIDTYAITDNIISSTNSSVTITPYVLDTLSVLNGNDKDAFIALFKTNTIFNSTIDDNGYAITKNTDGSFNIKIDTDKRIKIPSNGVTQTINYITMNEFKQQDLYIKNNQAYAFNKDNIRFIKKDNIYYIGEKTKSTINLCSSVKNFIAYLKNNEAIVTKDITLCPYNDNDIVETNFEGYTLSNQVGDDIKALFDQTNTYHVYKIQLPNTK